MAGKKKKGKGAVDPNERPLAENRKARHRFEVLDTLECGLCLLGSEVKSLRDGKMSLDESYARMIDGEVWLVGCDIPPYANASPLMNHQPRRSRKILMRRREIKKFASKAYESGLTLVPLKLYFKGGLVKLLLGVCRGLKMQDKREKLKTETVRRDIDRAIRRNL